MRHTPVSLDDQQPGRIRRRLIETWLKTAVGYLGMGALILGAFKLFGSTYHFQLGFGLTPFQSGLLTFASAVGALSMKFLAPFTLRTGGFRTVLIAAAIMGGFVYGVVSYLAPSSAVMLLPTLAVGIAVGVWCMRGLVAVLPDDLPRVHGHRRAPLRLDVIAQGGQPVRSDLLEHQLAQGLLQRALVGRSTHRERAVGELLALALRIALELEVAFDPLAEREGVRIRRLLLGLRTRR